MLRKTMGPIVAACLVLGACQDANAPMPVGPLAEANESEGRGFAERLYAIGTSISAGTCSDGNIANCQNMSYVAPSIERTALSGQDARRHRPGVVPAIVVTVSGSEKGTRLACDMRQATDTQRGAARRRVFNSAPMFRTTTSCVRPLGGWNAMIVPSRATS
jgi:hypothetical protein